MKKLLLIFFIIIPFLANAQLFAKAPDVTLYKASNGITYHVNDTVRLGKGSGQNGAFLYIEQRGIPLPSPRSGPGLPKTFTNSGLVVKRIKINKVNGVDKYLFIVDAGGPFRFSLYIDDAILACEVIPCSSIGQAPTLDVADEIKKLKSLLDSGAITQTEYDGQKKKLLNN
jgi:hypothetical protein